MKIFIVGHGRHGKDTVAEFLREQYGLTFESSSYFCAEHVVKPYLEENYGLKYHSVQECFDDRSNHREEWYRAIRTFNEENESRLSSSIFSKYDMYVGIRDRTEFLASKHLSDLAIWVDAFKRVPTADPTCKILPIDCDTIIDNNGTEEELKNKLTRLFSLICSQPVSI